MSAVVGVLLLVASVFGAIFAALLFRNPHRAAWARVEWLSDLTALVLVGTFAFGTAAFTYFSLSLSQPTGWILAVAGVLGTLALGWGAWRGLGVGARLAAYDREADANALQARSTPRTGRPVAPVAERAGGEPPVRPQGAGGAGGRKKAA